MQKGKSYVPVLVYTAVFILLEVVSADMLKKSSTLQDVWLNRASHAVLGKLWSGGESIRGHFHLQEINDELAAENFALHRELDMYRRVSEIETQADSAAKFPSGRYNYIPATVTKMSRGSSHNYIILNKGSEDGVKPYSGIITGKGVVGVISSVGEHNSYGLTLENPSICISARVRRNGYVGPLVWDGVHSGKAVLKDMPLHYETEPGDTLETSGYSAIFPAGIPVGATVRTFLKDGSASQTEIDLFQNLATLKYVTIVENPDRGSLRELEEKEGLK